MTATDKAYKIARAQRRSLSLPERLLWVRLRGAEVRFRKQHPIGPFVLDFYCASKRLAIEVDGVAHDMGDRPRRDEARTAWIESQGIEVLRIPAKDVLADPDSVADALIRLCAEPLHPPHELRAQGGAEGSAPARSSLSQRDGEGDRPRASGDGGGVQ